VQSGTKVVQRCLLIAMIQATSSSTQPAFWHHRLCREQWAAADHHRHVAIALALARARIMGARYPTTARRLRDASSGSRGHADRALVAADARQHPSGIRLTSRVPHITLKSIANNAEIDVLWEKWQARLSRCARSSTRR